MAKQESGSDRNPVKEGMDDQSEQHRHSTMGVHIFVRVCFFAVVKMRCYGVLEKVYEEVAAEHQQSAFPAGELQTFWNHLDHSGSQHEASSQRDKITEVIALPVFLHMTAPPKMFAAAAVRPSRMLVRIGVHAEYSLSVAGSVMLSVKVLTRLQAIW